MNRDVIGRISSATEVHRRAFQLMREELPGFIKGTFLRRPSARQIAEYCQVIAEREQTFWISVRREFPEIVNGAWQVNPDGSVEKLS